jgi:hypothetical protein
MNSGPSLRLGRAAYAIGQDLGDPAHPDAPGRRARTDPPALRAGLGLRPRALRAPLVFWERTKKTVAEHHESARSPARCSDFYVFT